MVVISPKCLHLWFSSIHNTGLIVHRFGPKSTKGRLRSQPGESVKYYDENYLNIRTSTNIKIFERGVKSIC